MSMHNLLELDDFDTPKQGAPGRPRPKPKPRVTATTSHQPQPKPRRRVERDVDEVMSMSSVSSEDHVAQNAFDNPVFQADEEELKKSKGDHRSRKLSSGSESEISQREIERRKMNGRTKVKLSTKGKHKINYAEDVNENSSSAWEEADTFLSVEKKMDDNSTILMPPSRRNIVTSPSSLKSIQTSPNVQPNKKSHVAINMEDLKDKDAEDDQKAEKDVEKSTEKPKPSKPRLVERWKTFLKSSSGQSQSLSIEKSAARPEKGRKSKPEDEMKQADNQINNKQTRIEMPSEDSTSDDETVKDIIKGASIEIEKPHVTKPDEPKSSKNSSIQLTKPEKTKLRFNIRGKSVSKEKLPESSDRLQKENSPETIKLPRRKRAEKPYSGNARGKKLLFGITIHSSDLLPLDPNIMHPVVKVTVMKQEGRLLHRSSGFLNSEDNDEGDSNFITNNSENKKRRRRGRSSTDRNPLQSESIFPIMTQPFKISHINPTFAPAWNELLLFEEPFERFLEETADVIIFFEVMDFLPMGRTAQIQTPGFHGSEEGWHKIAWAFLKPVGGNGVLNVERKLRLQLFKPVKLRNKDVLQGPEVFSWWKSEKRDKLLNTTLYVTLKGINPPSGAKASLKQLLSMRKDDLTEAIIESQLAATNSSKRSRKKGQNLDRAKETVDPRTQIQWGRLEGQSCKVPNKLIASLPVSQIQSLDISISGNVHCLKFSPCGLKLAAGLDSEELHAVLVFEIPSGNLLRCMKNHHGLIYDLAWKQMDVDDDSYVTYLASASADSTAIVWRMENNDESTLGIIKTLNHPSYVYCLKFHPTHPSLLVTGCFDFIIRIWDIANKRDAEGKGKTAMYPESNSQDSCPLFILDRHYSFVNALIFDNAGSYLFSGDGISCLYKWSIKSPTKRKSWKIERDVKLMKTGNIPINSLSLHPNGNRLLVHLRDNCLKILDVATLIQIQTFSGIVNDRLQIRSCFSPCGNLVLSGSEDPTICIWDADTSAIVQFMSPKNHPNCFVTSIDYHPFDFYLAVGLASAICEPSPVLLYHYETSKMPNVGNIAMVHSSVAKFKSNLRKKRNDYLYEDDNGLTRKNVTFASSKGDGSEKFLNIINKLDKALKEAQDPTRNRSRGHSLPRSLSFDGEIPPSKLPRPNSASNTAQRSRPQQAGSSSETDVANKADVPVPKKKSKSPRTYIEDRLEELILPLPQAAKTENIETENKNESKNITSPVSKPSETDTTMLLSPKNLPKPKRRPQSSKIPIRSKPESPQHNVGDTISTPTPGNSPNTNKREQHVPPIQVHDVEHEMQNHQLNDSDSKSNKLEENLLKDPKL